MVAKELLAREDIEEGLSVELTYLCYHTSIHIIKRFLAEREA
jgi:hypothetical protein